MITEIYSMALLYLHKYLYGGATTFTVHLMYKLQQNVVYRVGKRTESKPRDFGYELSYQNVSKDYVTKMDNPVIVQFKEEFLDVLDSLNNPTLIVHTTSRDISKNVVPHVQNIKIIVIRKVIQKFLEEEYGLESTFKLHPFYPYPVISNERHGAVSISRISFEKNIDMIVEANKMMTDPVKIYGCPSRQYVYNMLDSSFNDFYYGRFEKSFIRLTAILSEAKFVVDLSTPKNDGGGTQYTFLEAMHNRCALVLHRKWLELDPEYCDFKEGYNCYAVDNTSELAELINSDVDTTKIVNNASNLLQRHIDVSWSEFAQ